MKYMDRKGKANITSTHITKTEIKPKMTDKETTEQITAARILACIVRGSVQHQH